MITKMTLFEHEGYMIVTPNGKNGIFAWRDKGSRPRKRKVKSLGPIQEWDKIWFGAMFRSNRYPDQPWRFSNSGGKYPFAKIHLDADEFALLFELIPFLYKEWFGVTAPWSTPPVEMKREFKTDTEDDEVSRLERELASLRT